MRREQSTITRAAGRSLGRSARLSVSAAPSQGRGRCRKALLFTLTFLLLLIGTLPALAATPVGTVIANTATATYGNGLGLLPVTTASNTVSLTTVAFRTPAVIELLQYAPLAPGAVPTTVNPTEFSLSGESGPFEWLPAPHPLGSNIAIDLTNPVPLVPVNQYHAGEPIFVRLTDLDQNLDPAVAETVVVTITNSVTGDQEVLRLTETGPNTGVFIGYIQSTNGTAVVTGNGLMTIAAHSLIIASYTDPVDGSGATTQVLVDPYGIVFSTVNGAPLDGFTVTLMDAATNRPAAVYGDDGVSPYPATLVTGSVVVDAGGTAYNLPPGGYRFPFIAPGRYYLAVTTLAGYRVPSQVATSVIQALPGAPFAILDPGSRGEIFTVNPGPALHIDIPADQITGRLWLRKSAGKTTAAPGDFVPYRLLVENADPADPVLDVVVNDRLPKGFRYRKGSARIDQARVADPEISKDGRTLLFAVGRLEPGQSVEISYVAEIGIGAKTGSNAVNSAIASDTVTGTASNTATAVVRLTEDLFASTTTLMGRIAVDACGDREAGDGSGSGIPGVAVFLEDGTYSVSDQNGMFHFEAVKPGTHVVQVDVASLPEQYEMIRCEENTRFAGSAISQFVDLQGGALWRTDFYAAFKPKLTGEATIELRSVLHTPAPPAGEDSGETADASGRPGGGAAPPELPEVPEGMERIEYSVPVTTGEVPLRNLRLSVIMPDGALYHQGSSRLNALPVADPEHRGSVVTYRLGDVEPGWAGTVRFVAFVPLAGSPGDMPTRAVMMFDSPSARGMRTPVADNLLSRKTTKQSYYVPDVVLRPRFANLSAKLTAADYAQLDAIAENLRQVGFEHLVVSGHTDSNQIHGSGLRKFADNYELAMARATAVGSYLAETLQLEPDRISIYGVGPDEPVANNETDAGREQNRRVELMIINLQTTVSHELINLKDESGVQSVEITGLRPGEIWEEHRPTGKTGRGEMPAYTAAGLESEPPGLAWLWPDAGHHPPIPSVKLAVKHDPRQSLKLFINGREVAGLYLDGTVKRADGTLAATVWRGIHLQEGSNLFAAVEYDQNGAETARISREIHYSGPPVKAAFVPEKSHLAADGKKPPVIAVRLTDKDGHPARKGVIGEYSIDPPYQARQRTDELQAAPAIQPEANRLKYQVGEDGLALIELQPTTSTGEALIRFNLMSGEQEVRAWLTPEYRDWILVALAEGTVGYDRANGRIEPLGVQDDGRDYYENGRLAFYAKGRIKGDWLLTMAYDSAKETGGDRPGLHQSVDPNQYYLLYGDATEQRHDAPSSEKVYLRLERDQFYALFGDFATGMTVTELSRYSRNLTGFKSEMKSERFSYTLFASDTNQAYVKDELRGDGTSGLYRLSRNNIVLNSETITIVTRDRFQSEVIVSEQRLARWLDYTIDYEAGTLFFKAPVFSRDQEFNPIFIVVEFESFDASDSAWSYGGRGAVKFFDSRVETGATLIHEGATGSDGDLTGIDAVIQVTPATRLLAEAAMTRTDQAGVKTDGTAWLTELQHQSDKIDGRAYLRRQEPGFGLGQQAGSETGTMKSGGDLTYRLTDPWSIGLEAFRQENLATGAVRELAETRTGYTVKRYTLLGGLRLAEDTLGNGESRQSEQIFSGATYRYTERFSTEVRHDQTISSNDNSDFPTRTMLGADYRLNQSAALFAAQEWTRGANEETETSRIGIRATPWSGGQIGSTLEQQTTENGARVFSTTGLKQTWQVTERWSLDAGLDRSQTIRDNRSYDFNLNVAPASGASEDFTAVSLGAGYREEKWSWAGRMENRESQTEEKLSVFTGANGEVRDGLALAGSLMTYRTETVTGATSSNWELRLALAYRPIDTKVIVLNRLDLQQATERGGGSPYENRRLINNFVINLRPEEYTQISLQYGSKYVFETIDRDDYHGYTDLTGLECRYDLSERWDLGLRGLVLHSWELNQYRYGTGASVGYNPGKNLWLSVGYNFAGFRDRDFSKADFTSEGPFIKTRLKFDQAGIRDAVKWISGQ